MSSAIICVAGCSGCLKDSVLSFRKCIMLSIPSVCGMFVYRDDTSIETSMQFVGNLLVSMMLMNAVES